MPILFLDFTNRQLLLRKMSNFFLETAHYKCAPDRNWSEKKTGPVTELDNIWQWLPVYYRFVSLKKKWAIIPPCFCPENGQFIAQQINYHWNTADTCLLVLTKTILWKNTQNERQINTSKWNFGTRSPLKYKIRCDGSLRKKWVS